MSTNNTQTTVNDILIDILKGAKDAGSELYVAGKVGITHAVDFAIQQAPAVVQEFLSWKMGDAIFNCIFYSITVIILLSITIWAKKKIQTLKFYDDTIIVFSFILLFSVVFAVGSMISIKNSIETIIKIKLAPRVYIIEYVTGKK